MTIRAKLWSGGALLFAAAAIGTIVWLGGEDSTIGSSQTGSGAQIVAKSSAKNQEASIRLDILFSGYDPIQFRLRDRPRFNDNYIASQHDYESLKNLADNGDSMAAYLLSAHIYKCSHAFTTQTELDAAIDQIHQHQTINYPNADLPTHVGPEQTQQTIDRAVELFHSCSSMTAEQRSEGDYWLERSSELGFVGATMDLAENEPNIDESIRLFTRVWEDGTADALERLVSKYYATYEDGSDPKGRVRAYASLYLYTRLLEKMLGSGTGHGQIAAREVAYYQQLLDGATANMLPTEMDEGIEIAWKMLGANPNCCFSM